MPHSCSAESPVSFKAGSVESNMTGIFPKNKLQGGVSCKGWQSLSLCIACYMHQRRSQSKCWGMGFLVQQC